MRTGPVERGSATGRALALVGAATLGACGVSGAAIASAASGGGGGGSKSKPSPPAVTPPQARNNSNYVALEYELRDPQVGPAADPRVRVTPQYRYPDLDTWSDMTESSVPGSDDTGTRSDGTRALTLGKHRFVWNTVVDLRGEFAGIERRVAVRVLARYEDASHIHRAFRSLEGEIAIDNRIAATIYGAEATAPSDVRTSPVDVRPDGDGLLVADTGADIVERVDSLGRASRVAGFGIAGDSYGDGIDPGIVRLSAPVAFDVDPAGNVYANHGDRLLVTNRGSTPVVFGVHDGPDADAAADTVVVAPRTIAAARIPGLAKSRGARFHPSGVLLLANQLPDGDYEILAVNPLDPDDAASTSMTLGTVVVAPGATARLVGGGGDATDGAAGAATRVEDVVSIAVGPDGEIYYAERAASRVRVLNSTAAPLTIGGRVVAPGAVDTVAGGNGAGFSRAEDDHPARAARLNFPSAIDVSASRMLFVADTGNSRVRVVNLSDHRQTFAETMVETGDIATAVGGGSGGVGGKARAIRLYAPNAVALDARGDLLVAEDYSADKDVRDVVLVNGSTETVAAYGVTAGPAYSARVYDAAGRAGVPLMRPRAAHVRTAASQEAFFTDATTVRVINLDTAPAAFGGATVDPGGVAIVAGGAVPGFSGDGGPATSAAFDTPSALASDGAFQLYVADTGNDRIRCINLRDPTSGVAETAFGVVVAPGAVETVVGGAASPLPADGDGLSARAASLSGPLGAAYSPGGLLYVADTGHHRIRVVNNGAADATVAGVVVAPGSIATVLGGGVAGFTADGPGPWLVDTPTAVCANLDLVFFADSGNARIRVLNVSTSAVQVANVDVPPGEVRTLVGTGVRGNAGDGGEGPSAQVDTPRALFLQESGYRAALYFTDGPQHVLRLLNLAKEDPFVGTDLTVAIDGNRMPSATAPGGFVVTLAGGPNTPGTPNYPSFAGDGGEATGMRFDRPWGVVITTNRNNCLAHCLVIDEGNDRVRRFGAPPLRACTER